MDLSSAFVSTTEAAYIAGITDRDINRCVDEHILPDWLVDQGNRRLIARLGAALARFYFATEPELTADLRRHIIGVDISKRIIGRRDKACLLGLESSPRDLNWQVERRSLHIDLEGFVQATMERMGDVERAHEAVVSDPKILGGTPVFAGTRVPIDILLESLKTDMHPERVWAAYSHVPRSAIKWAEIYTAIHPRRGRPRRLSEIYPDWKLTSRKVVRPATKK